MKVKYITNLKQWYIFSYFLSVLVDELNHADVYARIASKYPDLTEISGAEIDDDGIRALSIDSNSSMVSIKFNKCTAIKDSSVSRLCKGCPLLKTLLLTNVWEKSEVTDESVRSIAKYCPDIECLSLAGWLKLTDASVTLLSTFTSLKSLNLSCCWDLTSAGVQSLLRSNGANLEELILCENDRSVCSFCDNELLRCVGECCHNLRVFEVQLNDAVSIDEASFIPLLQGCPLLEKFYVMCNYSALSDVILVGLSEYCPCLSKLQLDLGDYTDAGVIAFTSQCTGLVELELGQIDALTDQSLINIAKHCKQLKKLVLLDGGLCTDRGLCQLFESCTQLTYVHLHRLSRITHRSILTLAQCCRGLKNLGLFQNVALTHKATSYLVTLQELETLTLTFCSVPDCTFESIARYCHQLRSIDIYGCILSEQGFIALVTLGKRLTSLQIDNYGTKLELTPEIRARLTKRISPRRLKVCLDGSLTFLL